MNELLRALEKSADHPHFGRALACASAALNYGADPTRAVKYFIAPENDLTVRPSVRNWSDQRKADLERLRSAPEDDIFSAFCAVLENMRWLTHDIRYKGVSTWKR